MSGKLFGNLKSDGLEETQDRLGGFQPFDTDIHTGKIKVAYAGESQGGASSVTVIVEMGAKEYRETLWVTNKKGENFFLNKNDNSKKVPLPGFTVMEDICLVTTGEALADQNAEEKVVKIYDYEVKAEVPKSVQVLVDLIGKEVSLGILRQIENVNEKQGDGTYAATAKTKETNTIDKVFHTETKMTVVEARNGAEEPVFWDSWLERNKGQTRDRREIKDDQGGNSGRPGASNNTSAPQGGQTTERKSLFGNK